MKISRFAFISGVLALVGCSKPITQSKFRRAFLQKEKFEDDVYGHGYGDYLGGDSGLREIRYQNAKKYANHIDLDTVVSVYINKTTDGSEYVIELTDVDGVTNSLWLRGDKENSKLPVRTITPY